MISDEKFAVAQELTEQAYEYLKDGYEQALDALEKAEAEADRLQDENARLRSCLSDDADNARQIMAENAKLRELVSELWVSCPVHDSDCDECQHKGGRMGCELYDRMRELGVEVDG